MAKYDHGGGCPCGLYAECEPNCRFAPNPDATRTSTPEWRDLSAMEAQALHHEREAARIRAEIRARVEAESVVETVRARLAAGRAIADIDVHALVAEIYRLRGAK